MNFSNETLHYPYSKNDESNFQTTHEVSIPNDGYPLNETKLVCSLNEDCEYECDVEFEDKIEFVFEVVLLGIIGLFGLFGNTAAVVMFARMRKQLNFHRIMIMLAIFDSILVFINMLTFVTPHVSSEFNFDSIAPVIIPIAQIAMTGSIYATMAIALERYMIACKPFYVISHKWSAKRYIIPIVVFAILYNLPKFFELTTTECQIEEGGIKIVSLPAGTGKNVKVGVICKDDKVAHANPAGADISGSKAIIDDIKAEKIKFDVCITTPDMINKTEYVLSATELRENSEYYVAYTMWMNLILMGLLPFMILFVLNGLTLYSLIKQIRYLKQTPVVVENNDYNTKTSSNPSKQPFLAKTQKKKSEKNQQCETNTPRETQLAKISLMIVLVFIICHGVRWIPNIAELTQLYRNDKSIIYWPPWIDSTSNISHFLITLNSSANFYIYYASQLKEFGKWLFCKSNVKSTVNNRGVGLETDTTRISPMITRINMKENGGVRVTAPPGNVELVVVHGSR